MKVLQISPVAPPQLSGMSNTAGEIYKATVAVGAEVTFVSAFGNSTVKNIKHWHVPGTGFLAFTPKIISLAKEANVIHLHYPCYGNALMVSVARLLGNKKPLVISYHMDTVGRGLRKIIFALHAKFLAPHFLRQASVIVVASRDYAEHSLLSKYPDLMAKVVEIPFGINTISFLPVGTKDVVGKNILFVGALDEQHYFKGLSVLLKSLVQVPNAKLVVVGGGELLESYKSEANSLGLANRVVFAGRVSNELLASYYQTANVFVLPSLDRSEAFGMVILEAAASGVPAIASNIAGVRSVIKNNETGLLVEPNNIDDLAKALNTAFSNPEKLKQMGEQARAYALTQTWESVGKKYKEIYISLTCNL